MVHNKIKTLNNAFKVTIMLLFASLCLPLAGYSQTKQVDRLIWELRNDDLWARRRAAEALGEIKDPRAVEPLIAALKDEDEEVRMRAAVALGEIKDPRAVRPLIALLKNGGEEWSVREGAAKALVGDKRPSCR